MTLRTGSRLLVAMLVAGALSLQGCGFPGGGRKQARLSLILVTIDTLRADHVGCYGATWAETPVLDGLARDGVRFDQAVACAPLTLPSHATILTGLQPPAHGVRNNGMYALPEALTTLAEVLRAKGYRTAAFVGGYPVAAPFGLAQGFEVYDDTFRQAPGEGFFYSERRAGETNQAARGWLETLPAGEPFFVWIHYFDPHANYTPPPPYSVRFATRPYDGEVAYADACLGEILDLVKKLGRYDDTVIIATSDHGEGLGDHDEATHGLFVYETTLRVPLVIRLPGLDSKALGSVVREPVSLADIFPTALDLLKVEAPGGLHGMSLVPLIGAELAPAGRAIYAESLMPALEFGWAPLTVLRKGASKWIEAPRPELYDLAADPGEKRDIAAGGGAGPAGSAMRSELAALRNSLSAAGVGEASLRKMTPDEVARLQSLGYIQGRPGGPGGGRDPKDGVAILNRLEEGKTLARQGRYDRAIEAFREVVRQEPANITAVWRLAEGLLAAGRFREADDLLAGLASRQDAAASRAGSDPALYWLAGLRARTREMLGDREGSLALYRQAIEVEPDPAEAALRAAALLRQAGRGKEALDVAEKGLSRGSRRASLCAVAGDLAREAGDAPRAMAHYIRALQAAPELSEVWHALARTAFSAPGLVTDQAALKSLAARAGNVPAAHLVVGLLELTSGNLAAAKTSLRKARELDAADPDIAYFLGVAHLESGDLAAADAVLAPLAASRQDLFQMQRALGLVREKQGRRQEAVTLLRRALVLKPEDPVSRDALARLGAPP